MCLSVLTPTPYSLYLLSSNTSPGLILSSLPSPLNTLQLGHVPRAGSATTGHSVQGVLWPAQVEWMRSSLPLTASFYPGIWNRHVPSGGSSPEISSLPLNRLNMDVLFKRVFLTAFSSVFILSSSHQNDWLTQIFVSAICFDLLYIIKGELSVFQRIVTGYYGLNCVPPQKNTFVKIYRLRRSVEVLILRTCEYDLILK